MAENFPSMYKRPVLYAGRVFRRPYEQTRMTFSWSDRFNNVVSYQRIILRPYLQNVRGSKDFSTHRSTKRIKLWKYLKPIYSIHKKIDYSFTIQNELLRSFFHRPDYSRNPLNGPSKNKLGLGFSKPVFGQTSPMDLLKTHFINSASIFF